jgi:hypothetical protein
MRITKTKQAGQTCPECSKELEIGSEAIIVSISYEPRRLHKGCAAGFKKARQAGSKSRT